MKSTHSLSIVPQGSLKLTEADRQSILQELQYALANTSGKDMQVWASRAAVRPIFLAARRIHGLGQTALRVGSWSASEVKNLLAAHRNNALKQYVTDYMTATSNGAQSLKNTWENKQQEWSKAFRTNPKQTAATLMAAFLGFQTGSGGLDGNGGIPDLDLLYSIGAHRSPLSHSIVAGVMVEAMLLASADLITVVYKNLPDAHNPQWDNLHTASQNIMQTMSVGISLGISYHLAVDGLLQPASYKGLPFSMPLEGHQALFTLNAYLEGHDALKRGKAMGRQTLSDIRKSMEAGITGIRKLKIFNKT